MEKPRPFLTAALLCEKVLQEKDGTLSAVRIVDRMQYRLEGLPAGLDLKPGLPITCLISLKSGPITGTHTIKLIVERPNGNRKEILSKEFEFLGNDLGHNVVMNLGISVEQDGIHWFELTFDDEILTRIPLKIEQQQTEESLEQSSQKS